jgi:hypothetical protein
LEPSRNFVPVLRDIQNYFRFLLESGYQISSMEEFSMGDWEVTLQSKDNVITITNDQGRIILAFSPLGTTSRRENLFSLEAIVFFLSNSTRFVEESRGRFFRKGRGAQMERLAKLLQEYIGHIKPLFGSQFDLHRRSLSLARDRYFETYMARNISKR